MFNIFKSKAENQRELPCHIAIIMDGNGRWAKRRSLPRYAGHTYGALTFKKILKHCYTIGIKYVTFYAFSTENWSRPTEEVNAIMKLFGEYLDNAKSDLGDMDIRLNVLGDISVFSKELGEKIRDLQDYTKKNTTMVLNMAVNYGGRDEILNAIKQIVKDVKNGKNSDITAKMFESHLYTKGQPDPDLIIRPSGEKRLSNFLLWQAAYSEFWFANVLWPDFTTAHLDEAIRSYRNRNRRFGGVR